MAELVAAKTPPKFPLRVRRPSILAEAPLIAAVASFFSDRRLQALALFNANCEGGRLSWEGFQGLLAAHGCHLPSDHARRAFLAADTDKDGGLSRTEWVKMLTLTPPAAGGALPPAWRKCKILPGYCTAIRSASGMSSMHESCGAEDVASSTLVLPALAKGMHDGRVVKWVVAVGDAVLQGTARWRRAGGFFAAITLACRCAVTLLVHPGAPLCEVQPIDVQEEFSVHLKLHSLNRTHRDERIVPEAVPPKIQEWVNERGNRGLPPPLVVAAPCALVVGKILHPAPSRALEVGEPLALVVFTEPADGSAAGVEDRAEAAEAAVAGVASLEAVERREVFGEGARHLVAVRRRAQRAFQVAERDDSKALPTAAAGLSLHMGDLNLPRPVIFGGGGGKNRGGRGGAASSEAATAQRRTAVGPTRDGRSLEALVEALVDAKASVEVSAGTVGDGRMVTTGWPLCCLFPSMAPLLALGVVAVDPLCHAARLLGQVALLQSALSQDDHPAARAIARDLAARQAKHRHGATLASTRAAAVGGLRTSTGHSARSGVFVRNSSVSLDEAIALCLAHPRAQELRGVSKDAQGGEGAEAAPPPSLAGNPPAWVP